MNYIFHITKHQELRPALISNVYTPANYGTEGYIHCSYSHQVTSVLNRFYQDVPDLVLLMIDTHALDCPVVNENLEGGEELFPHIYSVLPVDAVVKVYPLTRDESGYWVIQDDLI